MIGWIGTKKARRLKSQSAGASDAGGASSSQLSKTSSGRTVNLRLRYFAISKAFFLLESSRYLYCGCLVMSNLSLKNGLTPCTCKMHLPPSITVNSSVDISSMQHCQVMSLFFAQKKQGLSQVSAFMIISFNYVMQYSLIFTIA